MGSVESRKRAALMCDNSVGYFNSRVSDAGPSKMSGGASILDQLHYASALAFVWASLVVELSASESLENDKPGSKVYVHPWLG